jgi:hypothetical protein
MDGIEFIVDEKGNKKAMVLPAEEYGEYFEDIEDILVAYKRLNEPRINLESVREMLIQKGRLDV